MRKHGIRFVDIEPVFYDPAAITLEDSSSDIEQRFITIGRDGLERLVVVVRAHRKDQLRIISARQATRIERRAYEEGI